MIMNRSIVTLSTAFLVVFTDATMTARGETKMSNIFEIHSWDETPYMELENGVKYSNAKLLKTYSGKLEGKGQLTYLMSYNESGHAYFTGLEHFEGNIAGLTGHIAIAHEGTFIDGVVESNFKIVDGSQQGELVGITGEGSYTTGHSMQVNYEFSFSKAEE